MSTRTENNHGRRCMRASLKDGGVVRISARDTSRARGPGTIQRRECRRRCVRTACRRRRPAAALRITFESDRCRSTRDGETQSLLVIAYSHKTVLSPTIGSRPGLIMAEIVPGIPIEAVILSHRSASFPCRVTPALNYPFQRGGETHCTT